MSYEVVYAPNVLDPLLELGQTSIVDCFEAAMGRLAANPVAASRPSRLPVPKGQSFDIHCDAEPGRRVHFRVHFL